MNQCVWKRSGPTEWNVEEGEEVFTHPEWRDRTCAALSTGSIRPIIKQSFTDRFRQIYNLTSESYHCGDKSMCSVKRVSLDFPSWCSSSLSPSGRRRRRRRCSPRTPPSARQSPGLWKPEEENRKTERVPLILNTPARRTFTLWTDFKSKVTWSLFIQSTGHNSTGVSEYYISC